jgi:sirohydrochlorin cobaltochelatase
MVDSLSSQHSQNSVNRQLNVPAAAEIDRSGVLLIGHGTRDAVGHEQFLALTDLLACQLAPQPVQGCLLELQRPNIAEGWELLARQGVRRIRAVPLLLFAAGHARSDIPQALADCQRNWPAIAWDQTRPLSRCPELLDLVVQRIDEAMAAAPLRPERTALVLVGRGSYDPCAQADLKLLTHCVGGRRRFRRIATAFYAMAQPKLPAVLDALASDPAIEAILIQPHLLFAGAIDQAIRALVAESQQRHPHCRHLCSHFLGPEPQIAAALVRRLAERSAYG